MPIVYARFGVAIHGLKARTAEDLEALRVEVRDAVVAVLVASRSRESSPWILDANDDVEVDIDEHAGLGDG